MHMRKLNLVLALVFLFQLVAVSCALGQASGVVETKLPNGLTVLMKESHAAPVFTAQIWFRVGSRNEHTGITGISHILEHMLFNASKNYEKGEITSLIRQRGGIENAATWTDFTYYWQLLSSENLELSLKMLAERAGNALLLDSEFQTERTVVLSEMQGRENQPDSELYKNLMATVFQAHPYQWPVIGWQSDVENVSRAQLVNYYQSYYHPNNATLVLVGDFDPAKALALVKKYFGSKPEGKLPRPVYTVEPKQTGKRVVEVHQAGFAGRVMIGYHTPAISDPDTYALMVLDQILSGGRSSRLYQALVETELATSAWSSADDRRDPALFMIGATARNKVQHDVIEKAIAEQVERAKTTLPTQDEMSAAKNQLEAYLIYQNDSVSDQGEQLGYYNTVIDWRYIETLIPSIKAVTPEQVRDVAAKYLTDENMTVGRFIPTEGASGGSPKPPSIGPEHRQQFRGIAYKTAPQRSTASAKPSKPAAPAPKPQQPASKLAKPHREVLPNGMVVIVQENHSNPTIAIAGNVKAGSYFDPAGKKGVADLVAEMVGRGTARRSALQIARETDFVGASVSTGSGVETASFSARSLAKDFSLVLDVLSDELMNASFPEDQFARAKGESLSSLEQSKESPDSQAMRAFRNAVFPSGHPYNELTFDDARKNLEAISRNDLVSFYKSYYRPDTAVIVIAGDVKAAEAVELVKQYFGGWVAQGPTPLVDVSSVDPPTEARRIDIPMADKREDSVVFGFPMGLKRSDPDYYAARIMNQALGGAGALGSILGDEIREKRGLVYDVYSTFDATLGAGPWYASMGTGPQNVEEAIQAVKQKVAEYKKNGPTQKQFDQAREFIIGVFPIALETNAGVARTLLSAETYGLGMDYLQNYPKLYRSVTLEQAKAAAAKYLHPQSATLVVAGPEKK